MNRCAPAVLNASGSPAVTGDEQVLKLQSNVDLYDGDTKSDKHRRGVLAITTHRLLWCDADRKSGIQWSLGMVMNVDRSSGGLFSSAKLMVYFLATPPAPAAAPGTVAVGAGAGAAAAPKPYLPPHHVKFSFKSGGMSDCDDVLRRALGKRSWVEASPASKRPKPAAFTTRQAGIGGVMKAKQDKIEASSKLTSTAFSSLQALVDNAKPIVALAERYAQSVASASGTEAAEGEQQQFGTLVRDIGIASPVTRAAAGDLYDQELARQLAEFLKPRLDKAGGLLTLTDAYCMYNRARGTQLVSPDDVVGACALFEKLGLGLHVRTFASGVKVVQLNSHSGEAAAKKLADVLTSREFINAPELATLWRIPLPIALQHLEEAERREVLCRDSTMRGLRFYPNRFSTLASTISHAEDPTNN